MSAQGENVSFTVTVKAPRETEVVIRNSQRLKVATGFGNLRADLARGLYKIRYQSAGAYEEHLFEIFDEPKPFEAPVLKFMSPVPLAGTATTHEYHEAGAARLDTLSAFTIGHGSEVALFVRDSDKTPSVGDDVAPWTGLTLHNLTGEVITDFSEVGVRDGNLGYSAALVEIEPGTYWLHQARGELAAVEIPIVASKDWRTTIFLDCIRQNDGVRRPDLYEAAIAIRRPDEPFRPDDDTLRLTEVVRQSLTHGRCGIDQSVIDGMLDSDFAYPMLGIFAGRALRLRDEPDPKLLDKLVTTLEQLIPDHPDVYALRVALLRVTKLSIPDNIQLEGPPMLRASWDDIVRASIDTPTLLPKKARWMRFAMTLSGSRLWLASLQGGESTTLDIDVNLSEVAQTESSATSDVLREGLQHLAKNVVSDVADKGDFTVDALIRAARNRIESVHWKELVLEQLPKLREGLADPSIAETPLAQLLRRELIAAIDAFTSGQAIRWSEIISASVVALSAPRDLVESVLATLLRLASRELPKREEIFLLVFGIQPTVPDSVKSELIEIDWPELAQSNTTSLEKLGDIFDASSLSPTPGSSATSPSEALAPQRASQVPPRFIRFIRALKPRRATAQAHRTHGGRQGHELLPADAPHRSLERRQFSLASSAMAATVVLALGTTLFMSLLREHGAGAANPHVTTVDPTTPDGTVGATVRALRSNDVGELLDLALPASQVAKIKADWNKEMNKDPVTDDDRKQYADTMTKLTEPDAEGKLYAEIEPKLKELDVHLAQRIPMMIAMGRGFAQSSIQQNKDLTDNQKQQAQDIVDATAKWAQATKFTDTILVKGAIAAICKTARDLNLKSIDEVRALSYDQAMLKAGIILGGAKQVLAVYGLNVDKILDSVKAETIFSAGDTAKVKVIYTAFGQPFSTESDLVKIDGRWYGKRAIKQWRDAADGATATDKPPEMRN